MPTWPNVEVPLTAQIIISSQPLTLLNQNLVLLLVYAFQPERPAAPTAAAAKVIRSVRNLSYDSKNIEE
eukprot:CAMPEP_0206364338 /NCGR_PEP_ID=MMETSP0294-20121207/2156_1 /ASSEMBLY_ACC=CAM_ASM_000327 /TAXON_ID=39354 /ORGANISM="Heterosigma akashiwo, Strain CCMP2393" /LENGTH=68 /DNA_ID=CAMNT_0053809911 /DNA_START=734 /DNA_END=940 /DNA_ORIENTATION=+